MVKTSGEAFDFIRLYWHRGLKVSEGVDDPSLTVRFGVAPFRFLKRHYARQIAKALRFELPAKVALKTEFGRIR
jgi:hypothetical protein